MRAALLALMLASSCAGQCGSIADGRAGSGAVGSGSVGGPRAGAVPVVGINWPEGGSYGTVELLWEAAKETSFADTDSVTTPTQFGALSEVAVTQSVAAAKPTYQDPCDVGPSVPCFYFDGGDHWFDSTARSSTKFIHDGTGASCYLIAEPTATASGYAWFGTGAWSVSEPGGMFYYTSGATDRVTLYVANGTAASALLPTGGTWGDTATRIAAFSHATARSPDMEIVWRGESSAETGSTGDYTITPSTSDPAFGVYIGKRPGPVAGGNVTAHIFAIACYSTYHDNTTMNAVIDAIEAELGAMPQ